MHNKYFNAWSLLCGILTLIIFPIVIYFFVMLLTLGEVRLSGKYYSLLVFSIGVVGFVILILLNTFNLKFSKWLDFLIVFFFNLIYSYYSFFITPVFEIGERNALGISGHAIAIRLSLQFGNILGIMVISILLLGLYYGLMKLSSKHRYELD